MQHGPILSRCTRAVCSPREKFSHRLKAIVHENFSREKFSRKMDESNIRFTRMRKSLGLTQEAVAKALNVTTRTIINWEGGHHEPRLTIRQTKALCELLGIESVQDLPDNIFEAEEVGSISVSDPENN